MSFTHTLNLLQSRAAVLSLGAVGKSVSPSLLLENRTVRLIEGLIA